MQKRDRKLAKIFGHVPGVPIGKTWDSRQECSNDAVHPGIMQGIYGSKIDGARSVALSGGYEDDEDKGDSFTYTGCGGRDLQSNHLGKRLRVGPQAYDQDFDSTPANMALKISSMTGKPVRVVRGYRLDSVFAPAQGYRYDGLYRVVKAWREKGKAGYLVCRFLFKRLPDQPEIPRTLYRPMTSSNLPKSRLPKRRRLEQPILRPQALASVRSSSPMEEVSTSRSLEELDSVRSASPPRSSRGKKRRIDDSDIEEISDSEDERAPSRLIARPAKQTQPRLRTDNIKKGSVPIYRPPWARG